MKTLDMPIEICEEPFFNPREKEGHCSYCWNFVC